MNVLGELKDLSVSGSLMVRPNDVRAEGTRKQILFSTIGTISGMAADVRDSGESSIWDMLISPATGFFTVSFPPLYRNTPVTVKLL